MSEYNGPDRRLRKAPLWPWLVPTLALVVTLLGAAISVVWFSALDVSALRAVQLELVKQEGEIGKNYGEIDKNRVDVQAQRDNDLIRVFAQIDKQTTGDEDERRRIEAEMNEMNGRLIRFDAQIGFLGGARPELRR